MLIIAVAGMHAATGLAILRYRLYDLDVILNRTVVYGLLTFLAGVIAGPSRAATAVRRWLAPAFRRHVVLVYAVVVTILLILLAWAPLASDRRLLGTLVIFALILVGFEVLRRQTLREFPEPAVAPTPDVKPPPGRAPA